MFKINNNSEHILEVSLAHYYSNQPLMSGNIFERKNKKIKVEGNINNYILNISVNKIKLPNEENIKQKAIEEYLKDLLESKNFDDEEDREIIINKLLEDSNYY